MQGMGRDALSGRATPALLAVSSIVLVVDQVTKALVREFIPAGGTAAGTSADIVLLPGVLTLTHVRNTGAAFGMLAGSQPLFIAVGAVVVLTIAAYWWRAASHDLLEAGALGLVAGGALGNLIDRVANGRVTDFVDVHIWPVFNVADSAVVVGTALLLLHLWLRVRSQASKDEDEHEEARDS